jgi:hypothetical protein
MSENTVLAPEDFETMTGEDPDHWPAQFLPGTMAKVVTNAEGIWTKITEDDGEIILATMANNPFGDFAVYGDPVAFKRENVRDILPPTFG